MTRFLLPVLGLLAATGCTTLATTHGAKTLKPGEVSIQRAISVQTGGSFVANTGLAIPQSQWLLRVGLKPDLDLGARLYIAGAGFDLRYRFLQQGKWHVAVDPGFAFTPIPSSGAFEWRTPLLAEVELHPKFSLAFQAQHILRDSWVAVDSDLGKGSAGRIDTFLGAGTRAAYHGRRIDLGVSVDAAGQPARWAGPAVSVGFDLAIHFPTRRTPVEE